MSAKEEGYIAHFYFLFIFNFYCSFIYISKWFSCCAHARSWEGVVVGKRLVAVIPIKTTRPCRVLTVAIQPFEFQSQVQAAQRVLVQKNENPRTYCA